MDTTEIRFNEQATLTRRFMNKNRVKEIYIENSDHKKIKEKNETLSSIIGTVAGIVAGIGLAAGLVIAGFNYAGLIGAGAAGIIGVIIGFVMIPGPSKESLEITEPKAADDSIIIRVNLKNKDDAKYFEEKWRTHKGKMVMATR